MLERVPEKIKLRLLDLANDEICTIMMLKSMKFRILMLSHCKKINVDKEMICFKFNNEVITDESTPETMDMRNGDIICWYHFKK